jgi:outer membrane protein assembly factor BamB
MKTRFPLVPLSLLVTVAAAFAADPVPTANWPQWRGPQSQGIAAGKNLPSQWSATSNIAWKTPIPGRGHSSPIIWGDRVFLTTAIEGEQIEGRPKGKTHKIPMDFVHPDAAGYDHKQTMKVLALDVKSGSVLWEKTVFSGPTFDSAHRSGSFASPTPATDGQYVYSFFGPEGLYAHDFQGKEVWKAATGEFGSISVGYGSSPTLYENLVIVLCDDDTGDNSTIQAFDKKTGKRVWSTKRPTGVSWATPVLARVGDHTELLTNGNRLIMSYNPATGEELWRSEGTAGNAVATPLLKDDVAFFSAGFPKKKTLAVRLGAKGDLSGTPNILWNYQKGTAYVASNILYGDYLYLITDAGVLTCLDAKTGEMKYDNGRPPTPGHFTASPVAVDGKLFITSEDGDTFVIQPGPEYKVLATNSLDEPVFASLAVAGGSMYIRGVSNLYKIGARAH